MGAVFRAFDERLGRIDDAIACLHLSLHAGALSKDWIENDPDLDPVRGDARFAGLLQDRTLTTKAQP